MHKFTAPLFSIIFFAFGANALELEPSDNSKLSKACVAAVESTGTLESILRENNVRVSNTNEVLCNNTPITEFARTYKKQDISHTNVNAVFKNADTSTESQLCIAAATSNEEFSRAKRRFLAKVSPKQVTCNGMALVKFAKQYNRAFNG
ncbi:hypothetical protein KUL42_30560 [Alteromonas sp. KUL42]|uniref:hypothetical protein n=1 Tax=Alteromonas sp. KUL42 TaxID=2480797 RepID=UPI0007921D6D|nr:hypothetical protein [Alteromonas sp. KUL42]KXJ61354.1 MAG: hypothetical protein AXW14_02515 [Alteromonas sp. Nap_26]TAP33783.1 hypothetical protein EYR97_14350 [Alteromonas sp. KUL42]GEA08295.1 hypothetical protein KUL42_30560 [Alteromonas sp. KUL42]